MRALVGIALASLGGCVSWLDTESYERDVTANPEIVEAALANTRSMRLDHVVLRDGVYEIQCSSGSGGRSVDGMVGANRFGSDVRSGEKIVLHKDDAISLFLESPEPGSHLRLVWHKGLSSEVVEEQDSTLDLVDLGPEIQVRRCSLTKHGLLSAVEQVQRAPTEYDVCGSNVSADAMDWWQILGWTIFPPIEIGRLVSRMFGGRLETPNRFEESVVGGSEVETHASVTTRHGKGGVKVRWELTWGTTGRAEAEVDLPPDGLYRIPLEDHEASMRQNIDMDRIGKLVVKALDSNATAEQDIDIMKVTERLEKARSGGKDGR